MDFSSGIKQAPSWRRVKLSFGDVGKAGGQRSAKICLESEPFLPKACAVAQLCFPFGRVQYHPGVEQCGRLDERLGFRLLGAAMDRQIVHGHCTVNVTELDSFVFFTAIWSCPRLARSAAVTVIRRDPLSTT